MDSNASPERMVSLLRGALDASEDGILVTDLAGTLLEYNNQFVKLWQIPHQLLDTRSHLAILPHNASWSKDPAAFVERIAEIRATTEVCLDVLQLRDGRLLERCSKPIVLEGQPAGRVWSFRDVTLASRVAELNSRLAAIVESADDAIISKTLEGIITSWNVGAESIFGYTASEVIGKHVTMLFPPELVPEEKNILDRIRRGLRIHHYETERVRKDGSRIIVSLSISPIKDAQGNVIGASKIARDITEQRRQEEALRTSEQKLRAVLEATPECVKIIALDGTLEYMNGAGLRVIECESESAVLGQCAFDMIAPEHRAKWIENHRRVCNGERLVWEFEIVGARGHRRWMETHAVPLPRPDGQFSQLAVTRDITAKRQQDDEREALLESERAARSAAEHASHLKDEFLATVSHELRTPLNAILGWSQILAMNPDAAEMQQGLEAIQRNARAQTQLIEDLLDMSRIISGKVRLDVQPTELANVIDAAVDAVRPSAESKNIQLRKIIDPQAGPVSGDPTRLQQVLWNLLTNAIKFTPKGGKVDVLLERVNSHLEVTVHDTGVGINAEFLPIIFERFRQVDSSTTRTYGGLGLGLSIVKHLVELHGGTVRAKSGGEGHGATFIVSLPLAPLRTTERREHPTTSRGLTLDCNEFNLERLKVLLVDDEPDARTLLTRLLSQCKAEVRTAASADEGLAMLKDFQPDVLISDIGMPAKDGYQFIREVRNLEASSGGKVPAIALTAFARSEDRTRAMMAGYHTHISKPIEPQELLATVGSLAGRTGKSG